MRRGSWRERGPGGQSVMRSLGHHADDPGPGAQRLLPVGTFASLAARAAQPVPSLGSMYM